MSISSKEVAQFKAAYENAEEDRKLYSFTIVAFLVISGLSAFHIGKIFPKIEGVFLFLIGLGIFISLFIILHSSYNTHFKKYLSLSAGIYVLYCLFMSIGAFKLEDLWSHGFADFLGVSILLIICFFLAYGVIAWPLGGAVRHVNNLKSD